MYSYSNSHRANLGAVRDSIAAQIARVPPEEKKPLAVIIELDEVILSTLHTSTSPAMAAPPEYADNPLLSGPFAAREFFTGRDGGPWPENSHICPMLPGAWELLATFKANNVEIFFTTFRDESLRVMMIENLMCMGIASPCSVPAERVANCLEAAKLSADKRIPLLCEKELTYGPNSRLLLHESAVCRNSYRAAVTNTHRVIMNISGHIRDLGVHGDNHVHIMHPFY
jgi:hypothetical protein